MIFDFMFMCFYTNYCRTNPILTAYTKPLKQAIFVFLLILLIGLIFLYLDFLLFTWTRINYTETKLIIFGILGILITTLIFYFFYQRYIGKKNQFEKLKERYKEITWITAIGGMLLFIVIALLPVIPFALKIISLSKTN